MSILQQVLDWTKGISAWQSDAIARLLAKQKLDPEDIDDLYALLKTEQGIVDDKGRVAKPLDADQIPAPVKPSTQVTLLAIKNLVNVNAIAENVKLPVAQSGLTIVYGDNGSGKSGYSRVLKRACRARDQTEPILPNANLSTGKGGQPQAVFEILMDGKPQDLTWIMGKPAPTELSSLSIFDSRCARAYLDNEDDFSYVPYGLDVFEGLAKLCRELKTRIEHEYAQFAVDLTPFVPLHGETEVGKIIRVLSAKTDPAVITKLATVSRDEHAQHAEIEKGLKENNPKEKAARLRATSKRVEVISTNAEIQGSSLSKDTILKLKDLADKYRTAKQAADLAAKQFKEGDALLPGTGGEAWRALFEAAQKFCLESHPGQEFPHLGEEAQCPLCQQPLADGATRLLKFQEFIQQEAEKEMQSRKTALSEVYTPLRKAVISLNLDEVTYGEILVLDKVLAEDCRSYEAVLTAHQKVVLDAATANVWDDIAKDIESPVARLKDLAAKLNAEAETLEKASDEKARATLIKTFSELDARIKLGLVKDAVVTSISRLSYQSNLNKCLGAVRTQGISLKSSEIAEKIVSEDLAKALNSEFKALGVGSLRVSLKSRGDKGKALHKLKLELPQIRNPGEILSEGEQRAVAIGSFLAEIVLGGGKGGIVFDDPVSSLDHRRRERVAHRLAAEACLRQVIVFTHDIYFLNVLVDSAKRLDVPYMTQSLEKREQGFGVSNPDLPFEGMNVTKRIGWLKNFHQEITKVHKAGDEPQHRELTGRAYTHLRVTWERAVEEVLLRQVVLRFRKGVETKRLAGVVVEDSDYAVVDAGMSKCSNYAHDKAMEGGIAMPEPDELMEDIVTLDDWRAKTQDRAEQTITKRK